MTTTHLPVPAQVEPDSIIDLVDDCREVSGVLSPYVSVPHLPAARGAMPVEISTGIADQLEGYETYGS